jgi:hypothetical protein
MIKPVSLTIALIVLLGWLTVASAQDNLPKLARTVRAGTTKIVTYDKKGRAIGRATGFFVASTGVVVTNYHVIKNAAQIRVWNSANEHSYADYVAAEDRKSDLAILVLVDDLDGAVPLQLTPRRPEVGETVVVVGNPANLNWTLSVGIISAYRTFQDVGPRIQISADLSPGSSGSPVVDTAGRVVGVAEGSIAEGQRLNFAIPAHNVAQLLFDDALSRLTAGTLVRQLDYPGAQPQSRSQFARTRELKPEEDLWAGTVDPEVSTIQLQVGAGTNGRYPILSIGPSTVYDYIRSSNSWTDSQFLVLQGARIEITAKGLVEMSNGKKSDPAGERFASRNKIMSREPTAGLIAVVGGDNDDFIFVGKRRVFVAPRTGILLLGINHGSLKIVRGSYRVTVQIQPALK